MNAPALLYAGIGWLNRIDIQDVDSDTSRRARIYEVKIQGSCRNKYRMSPRFVYAVRRGSLCYVIENR